MEAASFTLRQLQYQAKSPRYTLDWRTGDRQSRSGCCPEEQRINYIYTHTRRTLKSPDRRDGRRGVRCITRTGCEDRRWRELAQDRIGQPRFLIPQCWFIQYLTNITKLLPSVWFLCSVPTLSSVHFRNKSVQHHTSRGSVLSSCSGHQCI